MENLVVVKSMLKLFLDNVNIISELNLCSSNDIGFFYFESIAFSNKCVASGFSGRASRNQLVVRCRNFSLAPQKHFSLYLVPSMKHQGCPI